jgi:hypothetical protein
MGFCLPVCTFSLFSSAVAAAVLLSNNHRWAGVLSSQHCASPPVVVGGGGGDCVVAGTGDRGRKGGGQDRIGWVGECGVCREVDTGGNFRGGGCRGSLR